MDAEARRVFYGRALEAFRRAGIPFLIGGAYTMRLFANVRRKTKDLDVFLRGGRTGRSCARSSRAWVTGPAWCPVSG